jgi:superfamily II DNA or RNA helicase
VISRLTTPYHAKLIAHELLRRGPDRTEKLARTLADAQVDLNPHQVEAALFAFKSPLSNGALLADEVGLGKTIEAGLLLAQRWAEGRRQLIVICPANLRKQWSRELEEKFYLPSIIIESKLWNAEIKEGASNPFVRPHGKGAVVIISYPFASKHAKHLQRPAWDLVVMDEAHRLRNVCKPGNKTASVIRTAVLPHPKVLLTATPLQNSVNELYGLSTFIDPHYFGDEAAFKRSYGGKLDPDTCEDLAKRLKAFCHRTLRRQVQEYVKYTARHAMVHAFEPSDDEQRLYDGVSEYLSRDALKSLPNGQRQLIELILRKLLASSTFAIAGALETLRKRLEARLAEDAERTAQLTEQLTADYELAADTADEMFDDDMAEDAGVLSDEERSAIESEVNELGALQQLAVSIQRNAKGLKLLEALNRSFEKLDEMGALPKVLIFTESRKTQDYVVRLLQSETPWGDDIVLFNGTNSDASSKAIYREWKQRWAGTDKITGSATADMRAALVDKFRDSARIMIATEAAAEGLNLQFCSLIVNYDLPWNPQRIEQRIGRCHRYGQKHDVVVVNFLNTRNKADERVFDLLDKKFQLFEGVFGASDQVLGAIENGVEFETRILNIYRRCRSTAAIEAAFDQLRSEMEVSIADTMQQTKLKLLENFSAEVIERLRLTKQQAEQQRTRTEEWLWAVTEYVLAKDATFADGQQFELLHNPFPQLGDQVLGCYLMARESEDAHRYRIGHPLALAVVDHSAQAECPPVTLHFRQPSDLPRAASLDPVRGSSGVLEAWKLTASSREEHYDYIVCAGLDAIGMPINDEQVRRLFELPATAEPTLPRDHGCEGLIAEQGAVLIDKLRATHALAFEEEIEKLDRWASDRKELLELEIREVERLIREAKKESRLAVNLDEKVKLQRDIARLDREKSNKRASLFEAEDEIERDKDGLLSNAEDRLKLSQKSELLFRIGWQLG